MGQILTTRDVSRSSACQGMLERSGRAEFVKDSSVPWPLLNTCRQRKIWFINTDRLMWKLCCWPIAGAPVGMVSKLVIGVILDSGVMMTEIVEKQWLVSCLFDRPKFLGCDPAFRGMRIWIGISLAPLPSINKWILHIEVISVISSEKSYFWIPPLLSLLSLHESLLPLYQVKKGKGERMVAELPLFGSMFGVICQSLWWAHHDTSIIVTGLCRQGR